MRMTSRVFVIGRFYCLSTLGLKTITRLASKSENQFRWLKSMLKDLVTVSDLLRRAPIIEMRVYRERDNYVEFTFALLTFSNLLETSREEQSTPAEGEDVTRRAKFRSSLSPQKSEAVSSSPIPKSPVGQH